MHFWDLYSVPQTIYVYFVLFYYRSVSCLEIGIMKSSKWWFVVFFFFDQKCFALPNFCEIQDFFLILQRISWNFGFVCYIR